MRSRSDHVLPLHRSIRLLAFLLSAFLYVFSTTTPANAQEIEVYLEPGDPIAVAPLEMWPIGCRFRAVAPSGQVWSEVELSWTNARTNQLVDLRTAYFDGDGSAGGTISASVPADDDGIVLQCRTITWFPTINFPIYRNGEPVIVRRPAPRMAVASDSGMQPFNGVHKRDVWWNVTDKNTNLQWPRGGRVTEDVTIWHNPCYLPFVKASLSTDLNSNAQFPDQYITHPSMCSENCQVGAVQRYSLSSTWVAPVQVNDLYYSCAWANLSPREN